MTIFLSFSVFKVLLEKISTLRKLQSNQDNSSNKVSNDMPYTKTNLIQKKISTVNLCVYNSSHSLNLTIKTTVKVILSSKFVNK